MAKRKIRATGLAKIQTQAVGLEGPTFYAAAGRVIEGDEAALRKLMERSPDTFEWVEDEKSSPPKTTGGKSSGKG